METGLQDVREFIESLGDSIHKSGIFGCVNGHQGKVFALEAMTGRMLSIAKEWHMFPNGRMTRRADSILAGFNDMGGKHIIRQRTPDECAIELEYEDSFYTFRLTWEEAQQEPFVYQGKEADIISQLAKGQKPAFKPKYATPHSRMQMLWARLISDAVRAVLPQVVAGRYTPEEIGVLDSILASVSPAKLKPVMVAPEVPTPAKVEPVAEVAEPAQPETKEIEQEQQPSSESEATSLEAMPALIDDLQLSKLKELLSKSGAPSAAVNAACKRRGAESLDKLSMVAAGVWIGELASKFAEVKTFEQRTDGPCTPEQVQKIQKTIENLYQAGNQAIGETIRLKLKSAGLRLAELTFEEARKLQNSLDIKDVELWATHALKGIPSKKAG